MEQKTIKNHSLKYENGKINMAGVINVDQFDDKEIILRLSEQSLTLKGENFSIELMDTVGGNCIVKGRLISLNYHAKSEKLGLVKRIFK